MLASSRLNLHQWKDDTVLFLKEGPFLLTVVARVPVEDVQPGEPQVPRRRLGGRADDDAVLDHLHGTDRNIFYSLHRGSLDSDVIVRLLLLRRHV